MNVKNTKTVLLIDDDEDDCLLFGLALSSIDNNLKVKYADCADHLEELLQSSKPSIIFLDIHLPKINGFKCLQLIRRMPGFKDIPVILWSGCSCEKEVLEAYKEGACYYFVKPFNFNDLVEEVDKILHANGIISKEEPIFDLI